MPKLMTWILTLGVFLSLLGCSDEVVVSGDLKLTKSVGLKTTDSLVASMHRAMGEPSYSGNSVRVFLSNFESSLAVDGSVHTISAPLIMTQIGLGSYFCDRGLELDAAKPNEERRFLIGLSWGHNLSNNQAPVPMRRAYYGRLIENILGDPPQDGQLDELENLYQKMADGFSSKGTTEYRRTMKAVCTAAMGSIHLAVAK